MPKVNGAGSFGAWRCAYCRLTTRGRSDCTNCGGRRADGFSLRTRAGDWICPFCDTNNFSRREGCWGCQRARRTQPPPPPPTAEEIAEEVAKRKKYEENRKIAEEEKKKKKEDEERRWENHRLYPDAQPF